MAEFATIARPYAKALFELANEKHQIESWLTGLKELAWSVDQARVAALIEDTRTNSKEKVAGDKTFRNFVHVVADEKRLLVLPEIYVQYQDLVLSRNNTKKAVIYSAFEFASEGQKAKIVADLEQHFNTRLEAVFNVEPSLIAGIKVEVDDQVLDLSIQGKLQKLYTAMTN